MIDGERKRLGEVAVRSPDARIYDARRSRGKARPEAAQFGKERRLVVQLELAGVEPHSQLDLARAWKPSRRKPASFEERREVEDAVLAEVAAVCKRYRASVVTDQYAAQPIVDYLHQHGLSVETIAMTAATKTTMFGEHETRLFAHSSARAGARRRHRARSETVAALADEPRHSGEPPRSRGTITQMRVLTGRQLVALLPRCHHDQW